MSFVHLHVHTGYSLLDSSARIEELVNRAKELRMTSLAITDHGTMFGVIDFYDACLKAGIKPILGCEVYVAPDSRFEKDAKKKKYHHLVLLAENMTGYKNLMKLVSKGFMEGFYYKPRVDYELLLKYHEGLIATSACLAGIVSTKLREESYEAAKKEALRLSELFGKDNFFIELQDHGLPMEKNVNQYLVSLSRETGIPLIATNDVHYVYQEDAYSHDILICIGTKQKIGEARTKFYEGDQYYLKSEEEMRELFSTLPEALENTEKIAKRCEVELRFGEYHLPKYDVPEGFSSEIYLRQVCEKGFSERYPKENYSKKEMEELKERLDYELSVIMNMGFTDYFLIVWDYVRFAKENGIPVGAGRGSAAGSMVSYCLGITDIDPIKYNLLFERFLNPERLTMPDIDVDFCVLRREEIIEYVTKKYGRERVVQIGAFDTLGARSVVRDVGRSLDYPPNYCDRLAKMIPKGEITIDSALLQNPDFAKAYEEEEAKVLIDLSKKLEGLPRHMTIHAAGVVISKEAVDEYVPLAVGKAGVVASQFTKETVERLGLLKMDILGLRNLTVIDATLKQINEKRKKEGKEELNLKDIDYDDKNVFDLIGQGKTEGVFQLESRGMKKFMKELKPDNLEDIIAGISLYRPGPMDFIPKYVEGKKNKDSISYDCNELKPILKDTYGCIVYQEQVMQIVRDLAGYSYGRSDLLRRAMSKKKGDDIIKDKNTFIYGNEKEGIKGAVANGIEEKVAIKIYDDMLDFANYAFNRSHAAAYSVITYQTAYLKFYYQKEYMAALLTSVIDKIEKVSAYVEACRGMGVKLLLPDINTGELEFIAVEEGVRYGLSAIKGLGDGIIQSILKERKENGAFRSLSDFLTRLSPLKISKNNVEGLIKAGALDSLKGTRKEKLAVYRSMMERAAYQREQKKGGQLSFFDIMPEEEKEAFEIPMPVLGEFDNEVFLALEKEIAGVYLSGHPLDDYKDLLEANVTAESLDFRLESKEEEGENVNAEENTEEVLGVEDGASYIVGGIVKKITVRYTRYNDRLISVELEDRLGTMDVTIFEKTYQHYEGLLREEGRYLIKGRARVSKNYNPSLTADYIVPFSEVPRELWLKFENKKKYGEVEEEIFGAFHEKGNMKVVIYFKEENQFRVLKKLGGVSVDELLLQKFYQAFGEDNVKIMAKSIEEMGKMY